MKNIKFYLGAFLCVFCIESSFATIVTILLSIVGYVVAHDVIFWGLWGTLEAWCLIDALYLTFTQKEDPWRKRIK